MNPACKTGLFAIVLALGGCGETNLVRDAAQGVGLAGRPSPPASFVEQSRTDAPSGFMAVGVSAPARDAPRKTPAEFKALEAQLEADKSRLEAEGAAAKLAGATPAPKPPVVPR
ncbi:MAG: hypothetical protein ACRCUE_12200 [Bosea sp. (in: a-proteobacteria)]